MYRSRLYVLCVVRIELQDNHPCTHTSARNNTSARSQRPCSELRSARNAHSTYVRARVVRRSTSLPQPCVCPAQLTTAALVHTGAAGALLSSAAHVVATLEIALLTYMIIEREKDEGLSHNYLVHNTYRTLLPTACCFGLLGAIQK